MGARTSEVKAELKSLLLTIMLVVCRVPIDYRVLYLEKAGTFMTIAVRSLNPKCVPLLN
jgi:hypothetical protein